MLAKFHILTSLKYMQYCYYQSFIDILLFSSDHAAIQSRTHHQTTRCRHGGAVNMYHNGACSTRRGESVVCTLRKS